MDDTTNRKLASIQVIESVMPHPNEDANNLEMAAIVDLGWPIVIRKGEVKPGEKVVYCEIDSMLPNAEWLPAAISVKIKNSMPFRLKTIKIMGQYSQGLIIPLRDSMPIDNIQDIPVGVCVTEQLGITKYQPPEFTGKYSHQSGKQKVISFPRDVVSRTDEERIESNTSYLREFEGKRWVATTKMDGTSATYFVKYEDGNVPKLVVCSRNQIREFAEEGCCPYWDIARKYDILNVLIANPDVCIQGEICGPNIQKNIAKLKDIDFFVFNVIDLKTKKKLPYDDAVNVVTSMGMKFVPLAARGDNFQFKTVDELFKIAHGKYEGTSNVREGVVFRTECQTKSFKVINRDYLIKND